MNAHRRIAAALAIAAATATPIATLAAPSPEPSIPIDTPRFSKATALDTDVTLRWTLHPSTHHGESDPGPYVATGSVAIVSGAAQTVTLVSLSTLGVTPPNITQIIPQTETEACGAHDAIDIVPLPNSVAPAVIVTTVAIGKGCYPIRHVLLPKTEKSHAYRIVAAYSFAPTPTSPNPSPQTRTIRILHVTPLTLPGHNNTFIIDARDTNDRIATIAIDTATPDQIAGKTLILKDAANGFEGNAYIAPPTQPPH